MLESVFKSGQKIIYFIFQNITAVWSEGQIKAWQGLSESFESQTADKWRTIYIITRPAFALWNLLPWVHLTVYPTELRSMYDYQLVELLGEFGWIMRRP